MAKRNKSQQRRVKNLALVFTLTTIVLVTSTFAWFIGMRTVNVNQFDVTIAAVDGLSLSLDGENWTEKLTVDKDAANYDGNTNVWAEKGLVPMSTVGDMDTTSSTMKLFQKASLTKTDGGYRLLASRVNNYTQDAENNNLYTEGNGYVAFDLFIKNLSGEEYYYQNDPKNEEAIYLTNDSSVKVATSGVKGTGIENSVRVAFAQVGRVMATNTDLNMIRALSCGNTTTDKTGATGICRKAQIWEPNDRNHVDGAIEYYTESCKKRTDATTYAKDTACAAITNGLAYPTYAIKDIINYKNEDTTLPVVDVYDGAEYNGYTGSTAGLEAVDTFTDSEKLLAGTARQDFITLAPNSITKVRVYVYIEGQDIDNYDLAQIGKKISVNFGFTKQRFNEDDLGYTGDATNEGDGPFVWDATANEGAGAYKQATDTTKPFIKLSGEGVTNDTVSVAKGTTFNLDSVTAKAYDKESLFAQTQDETGKDVYTVTTTTEKELTGATIEKTGTVNTAVAGTYQVVYSVKDAAGNLGTKVLTVIVTE